MTKENYYAVKASNAVILPWTIARHIEDTIRLWEKNTNARFSDALRGGDEIVSITVESHRAVLSLNPPESIFDAIRREVDNA